MTAPARKSFLGSVEFKAGQEGAFRARIATFGTVDRDGDVSLVGSFPDGKTIPISAYGHTSWQGALPVGKGVISSDAEGAYVDGQFFTDTTSGRDTYRTVKALAADGLGEWSHGYHVKSGSVLPAELAAWPGATRILKSIDVFEASPVLVGAGIGTRTEMVKGAVLAPTDQQLIEQTANALLFAESAAALADAGAAGKAIGDGAFEYSEIHPDSVPAETKALAGRALLVSCADLGIPAPRVTWMRPGWPDPAAKRIVSDTSILAIAYPSKSEIWLDYRLSGWDLVEAVAHEVKHVALGHQVGAEDDATAYGRAARDWRIS